MLRIHKMLFPLQCLFFGAIWLSLSCNAQTNGRKAATGSTKLLDVTYYPDDNNFAKAAVILNDGYIITGQKFSKQEGLADMMRSAIIKLDLKGRIVKEEFLGYTGYRDPHERAMIENVMKIDAQTIFHIGSKSDKLWIRVLNGNLDVRRDTVVAAIPVTGITPPRLGRKGNGCYVITEPAGIVIVDSGARHFEYHSLVKAKSALNTADFSVADGTFDEASGLFYIAGSMCTKKEGTACKEYKQLLLVYDPGSGNIVREVFLNEFYHVKCVKMYNGRLYLAGESIQTRAAKPSKQSSRLVDMDWMVSIYTTQGNHINQFILDIEDSELVYDLSVRKDKIYLAGECFDESASNFKALYAVFDLKGTVLDKQLIFSDPVFNRENRFTKIYHTADDKTLLLGKGKGWRILLLQ